LFVNIFVGSLPFATREETLREAFEAHGEVTSARIITDRETGRSRGFGFVEMPNEEEARTAIDALNGSDFEGRTINVNEARPRPERRPRQDRW
jgi:RNA recognition motif-containing protein